MKSLMLALDYISSEGCVIELCKSRVVLTENTSPYSPITSFSWICFRGPKLLGQSRKLLKGLCCGNKLTSFAGGLNFQYSSLCNVQFHTLSSGPFYMSMFLKLLPHFPLKTTSPLSYMFLKVSGLFILLNTAL